MGSRFRGSRVHGFRVQGSKVQGSKVQGWEVPCAVRFQYPLRHPPDAADVLVHRGQTGPTTAGAEPGAAGTGADPAAVLRLPHRRRRRARALSEDPRVPCSTSRRQTDRVKYQELGKTTMGNPYVLATVSSPENLATARQAHRDQPTAGRSARPVRSGGEKAGAGRPGLLPALRDDPLDGGRQHAGDHRDRASAGDR